VAVASLGQRDGAAMINLTQQQIEAMLPKG
jgi:hypothetical protein